MIWEYWNTGLSTIRYDFYPFFQHSIIPLATLINKTLIYNILNYSICRTYVNLIIYPYVFIISIKFATLE